MALSLSEAIGQYVCGRVGQHEANAVESPTQAGAIRRSESRARDHGALGVVVQLPVDRVEPRPAVVVGERNAAAELGDGRWRVEGIAFEKRQTEFVGQRLTQGRLARARHSHHDYHHLGDDRACHEAR